MPLRIAFYSPADLNLLDGSSIWVQSIAEVLHSAPNVEITVPLKAPERRDVVTGMLRQLERVRLVDPVSAGRTDLWGLGSADVLDLIEKLDHEQPFDVILLRSYALCRLAAERPRLAGRLWSAYILEPERDLRSRQHLDTLARITDASARVLVQSEEMRALLESVVPSVGDKAILLPPAIPSDAPRPDSGRIVPRLLYTGKFSPLYPVPLMIEIFRDLRATHPDLEFHVAGDKFHRTPEATEWVLGLERALSDTPGLVWHGGISRAAVERVLASGGIGLNLWDQRHDLPMNNLVLSTKTLDYCAVGLPIILNRTASHEAMLGRDYPLFVTSLDETRGLLERLLTDADLYRRAAERTWSASRAFTYPEVFARLAPYLPRTAGSSARDEDVASHDRPKLEGASLNLGVVATTGVTDAALGVLQLLRQRDDRYRLIVLGEPDSATRERLESDERLASSVSIETDPPGGMASWLRKVGFLVADADGPSVIHARASGSIPIVVGSGDSGSAASAADAIAAVIAEGTWSERSEQARREARAG